MSEGQRPMGGEDRGWGNDPYEEAAFELDLPLPPPPGDPPSPELGLALEAGGGLPGLPDLEIVDVSSAEEQARVAEVSKPDTGTGHARRIAPAGAPEIVRAAPRAASLDANDPAERAEVLALADFGPAPTALWAVVPYALLVFNRRRALGKDIDALVRLREQASADADEALAHLGRAMHVQRDEPLLSSLGELLTAADRAEELAREKTDELARDREVSATQRETISKKAAEIERKAAPYRDRETRLATQMATRETDLRRTEARLQRVEIELRNQRASATPDQARLELLTAERAARQAEVEAARGQVEDLTPELAQARRELASMVSAANDLDRQRRAIDSARDRAEKTQLSSAGAAEREYGDALRQMASVALERGVGDELAPTESRQARLLLTALHAREREVAMHEAARGAYDVSAFRKGAAVILAVGALVLAMVLFALFR